MTHGVYWLASFPKSGSTWMRALIHNLLLETDGPADINALEGTSEYASALCVFEFHSLLDPGLLTDKELRRIRPGVHDAVAVAAPFPPFIKVHDAWSLTEDGRPLLGTAMRGAIYIVRDPRDVAVSLAHHSDQTLDWAIEKLNAPDLHFGAPRDRGPRYLRYKLGGWGAHVRSWLDEATLPIHVVRYEDLHRAPVATFGAAMAFAGIAAGGEALDRAVRQADFAELRRQEGEKGFMERVSRQHRFFREGRAGGWRDVLTAKQVASILRHQSSMMERVGYDTSTP